MSIRSLVSKPFKLLFHALTQPPAPIRDAAPPAEWLDDHEFSFDAIGRGLNGLPPRRLSDKRPD